MVRPRKRKYRSLRLLESSARMQCLYLRLMTRMKSEKLQLNFKEEKPWVILKRYKLTLTLRKHLKVNQFSRKILQKRRPLVMLLKFLLMSKRT